MGAITADDGKVVVDVDASISMLEQKFATVDRRIQQTVTNAEALGGRLDRALTYTGRDQYLADRSAARRAGIQQSIDDVGTKQAELDAVNAKLQAMEARAAGAGTGMRKLAAGGLVAGIAINAVGRNLDEAGGEAGRMGQAISHLTSLNFVGFWRDVSSEVGTTAAELAKINDVGMLAAAALEADAIGADKLAANARAAASALAAMNAEASVTASIGAAAARTGLPAAAADAAQFGERSSRFGRGAGAVSESNAVTYPDVKDPLVGLSQRLRTAVAAARSTPGVKDDIAQLTRAAAALQGQLGQRGITDADREKIYSAIASINAEIEAGQASLKPKAAKEPPLVPVALDIALQQAELTKPIQDDLKALQKIDGWLTAKIASETDQNRKLQQLSRLGQTRSQIAALLAQQKPTEQPQINDLFEGPTLTSKPYQFATQFGFKPKASTLLTDIRGQLAREKQLNADLNRIRRKGGSSDLVASLAGEGVDAADRIHTLAGADKGLVKQYSAAFSAREKQQQQLANLVANVRTATIRVENATIAGRSTQTSDKFAAVGLTGAR